MEREEFERALDTITAGAWKSQELMRNHTTFRIGGPAEYFISPTTVKQIQEIYILCKKADMPCTVIGNGSNVLVSDRGLKGVVLHFGKSFSNVEQEGVILRAQAGVLLAALAGKAARFGLSGIEFAGGIPGTLGGAIVMNAGAYEGEMKQIIESVTLLTEDADIIELSGEEMKFGYRHSIVMEKPYYVLEARLRLEEGNIMQIQEKMAQFNRKRREKQPLEYPSAGSTFKRPEGNFAGKLIMEAGLAGFSCGGAQISTKHCGFVINTGGATAEDVGILIKRVQEIVYEKTKVQLEPEVRYLGEFELLKLC